MTREIIWKHAKNRTPSKGNIYVDLSKTNLTKILPRLSQNYLKCSQPPTFLLQPPYLAHFSRKSKSVQTVLARLKSHKLAPSHCNFHVLYWYIQLFCNSFVVRSIKSLIAAVVTSTSYGHQKKSEADLRAKSVLHKSIWILPK